MGAHQRNVSIHAPTWGATETWETDVAVDVFQSTRPRGARQDLDSFIEHTGCFNPRAHVGRDMPTSVHRNLEKCFNPRAHVGRDLSFFLSRYQIHVSIHAPTWGATTKYETLALELRVSIHAPTWGATT